MSTNFFTNKHGNTLLEKFRWIFENHTDIECFDALIGYFKASGYFALRPFLNDVPQIRILVGIEIDKLLAHFHARGLLFQGNKELMRIFKDLDLVEQLGSGVPRILQSYSKDCFKFSENFLRMIFPTAAALVEQITPQVTPQVEALLSVMNRELSRTEIQEKLNLTDKKNFTENYLKPALEWGLIEMTVPGKPRSSLQKYRLTMKGKTLKMQRTIS